MSVSVSRVARVLLSDIEPFSTHVLKVPLRGYQRDPARALVRSVLLREGHEFLWVFPRQTGKNEVLAQVQVYLLNLLQRAGGNLVFGAEGDGVGRAVRRLDERLDNAWNRGKWRKAGRPDRRVLGKAAVVFLSTNPQAASRGETAHWLLAIDEMQDNDSAHLEAVFEPMRAANNATSLYVGTVKTTTDALWQKKLQLEALQEVDGVQRVFFVLPEQVIAENASYKAFLDGKVAKFGRFHPIVASEYFLEPIDGAGGLFDARRLGLMWGDHDWLPGPGAGVHAVVIDVGGIDEAATDAVAQLDNPGRDYTVATAIQILPPGGDRVLPAYLARQVMADQGSRHFESYDGRPALSVRLAEFIEHWRAVAVVCDASGVGAGLADWLGARFPGRVHPFLFTSVSKAQLGNDFLACIETGRFKYFRSWREFDDAWWFFEQARSCRYELGPGRNIERGLRWGVPASLTVDTPDGRVVVHDDRLMSGALTAHLDELWREGKIVLGEGRSAQIAPRDILSDLRFDDRG